MTRLTLSELGWKPCFQSQLDPAQWEQAWPARITARHRDQIVATGEQGEWLFAESEFMGLPNCAIGDWLWLSGDPPRIEGLLERQSLLQRKSAGEETNTQLIAANIDTLLVVTSCNREFNPARLQRYLAVALDGRMEPVIVLTKIDQCDDMEAFRQAAAGLRPGQAVECINATQADGVEAIRAWCGPGQTVAMLGSSGVGKSTLANSLCASTQATGAVRAGDQKGRHTTTARSLHRVPGGGLLIDNPGIRELQMPDCESGINALFADVLAFAQCRFNDCRHAAEPGCGVRAAIAAGVLPAERLYGYRKLLDEQASNAESLAQKRQRLRAQGKNYVGIQTGKRRLKGREQD